MAPELSDTKYRQPVRRWRALDRPWDRRIQIRRAISSSSMAGSNAMSCSARL